MIYVVAFTPCIIMLLMVCYWILTSIKDKRWCRHSYLTSDVSFDIPPSREYLRINKIKIYCVDCGKTIYQLTDTDITAEDYDPISEAKEILKFGTQSGRKNYGV